MRLFLIAAIVLIVFAIIAAAFGSCLGIEAMVWLCASILAFYVDLLWGWDFVGGRPVRRQGPPPTI